MMTQKQIDSLRAHMTLAGITTTDVAVKFDVGRSAVNQVITGDAVATRIQDYISGVIGYWPTGWKRKGDSRPA